jgi:hypothetical protein
VLAGEKELFFFYCTSGSKQGDTFSRMPKQSEKLFMGIFQRSQYVSQLATLSLRMLFLSAAAR